MSEDLWGEDEQFSDMPEAAQTGKDGKPPQATHQYAPPVIPPQAPQQRRAPAPAPQPAPEPEYEEDLNISPLNVENDLETEDDFEDVLSDAHLRLEQGSLYKMIMNQDIFDGEDADPKAIQNVQKEIRKFARERMEVMLGMRQEPSQEVAVISSPFNDLEVEVLKRLASKATNGATETEEANEVANTFKQAPKRNSIKPISGGQNKKPAIAAPVQRKNKPLPTKPTAPVKRTKQELLIEQIAREEGVPVELLELNTKGVGGKPISELNATELEERNRLAAERRGTQVKSNTAVPMATYEQQEQMYTRQTSAFGSTPFGASILDAVKKMPIKNY